MLAKLYLWFWFHTEFWLTPVNRRPYTFIMRDWLYRHLIAFGLIIVAFYAGMCVLSLYSAITAIILTALGSLLLAHLVWGTPWIEGQQEYPEYLGED